MRFLYDSYSDIGKRDKNEDSFLVCEREGALIAAVADGLGGCRGGEVASAFAVDELKQRFEANAALDLGKALEEINSGLLLKQRELGMKMKTTICAVLINAEHTVAANIGDSRIYAFKDDRIVFQSTDHSVAQMCVDLGEITPEGIRTHEDRCILTRSLGSKQDIRADITVLDNSSYDSLLICSDGFWGGVVEQQMCSALEQSETPGEWLGTMRKLCGTEINSDNDNNTAVVINIKEG